MNYMRLELNSIDASPSPDNDAISFTFHLANSDRDAIILDCDFEIWQTTDTSGNNARRVTRLVKDVRATATDPNAQLRARLVPKQEIDFRLLWLADKRSIQAIEDHRKGRSPIFQIRSHLLVASGLVPERGSLQEIGWEYPVTGNGWPLWKEVPDSHWARILATLGFSHPIVDSLSWPAMPPAFSRSEKHLRDAWHRHRVGEFEGSLVACYKAFECLGFNLFKNDEIKRREVVDLLMDGVEGEKKEVVLQLLKTLQDFCHLARHERGDPISIRHEDSQLALICASAALSYLAPLYKAE